MRLREVFRYEFDYPLRSPSTWAYAAFLFLIMAWGVAATADGGDAVKANAPQKAAQGIVSFGGLFGLLVSAALFGDAAIRDAAAGMDPLLYTTRLRKAEYLGGRFLAALAINVIVVLAVPLGFWVATMTIVEADALGPNRLAAYVQPLLLFVLPNIILIGSIPASLASRRCSCGTVCSGSRSRQACSPCCIARSDSRTRTRTASADRGCGCACGRGRGGGGPRPPIRRRNDDGRGVFHESPESSGVGRSCGRRSLSHAIRWRK